MKLGIAGKNLRKKTRQIGDNAEKLALEFLRSRTLKLIENNFNCRHGEIDLIMQHGEQLVFVEVRYRKHHQYGTGAESVDYRKQQKILKSAETFLQRNVNYRNVPCRIDVVSVGPNDDNINWIKNAIEA